MELSSVDAQKLQAAHSVATNQFIFIQAMPLGEFFQYVERIKSEAFRPYRVRPYWLDGQPYVAAILRRDQRDWKLQVFEDPQQLRAANQSQQELGYVPTELSGYRTANEDRYLIVWTEQDEFSGDRRITVGHELEDESELIPPPVPGMANVAWQGFRSASSDSIRHSIVWRDGGRQASLFRRVVKGDQSVVVQPFARFVNDEIVRLGELPDGAALFGVSTVNFRAIEQRTLVNQELVEHQARVRYLVAAGFLPLTVAVDVDPVRGTPVCTSSWVRPVRVDRRLAPDDCTDWLTRQ